MGEWDVPLSYFVKIYNTVKKGQFYMANYVYKESKVTTKKLVGLYDAEKHTIDVDGESKDIVEELKDFEGAAIEVVVKVKEETDLTDED